MQTVLGPGQQRVLSLLYGLGVGYPLAMAALHLLWGLNDHSLMLPFLLLGLPLAGALLLGFSDLPWKTRLLQGLKHSLLLFFVPLLTLLAWVMLDFSHCGFAGSH